MGEQLVRKRVLFTGRQPLQQCDGDHRSGNVQISGFGDCPSTFAFAHWCDAEALFGVDKLVVVFPDIVGVLSTMANPWTALPVLKQSKC